MNGITELNVTENISLVTFSKAPSDCVFIVAAFAEFAKRGINIDMISQTAPQGDTVSLSFTVSDADMVTALEAIRSLRAACPTVVPLVTSGNCKLQLYGSDMRDMSGVGAAVLKTVSDSGAQMIIITTSEVDISILTSPTTLSECVAALESEFGVTAVRK